MEKKNQSDDVMIVELMRNIDCGLSEVLADLVSGGEYQGPFLIALDNNADVDKLIELCPEQNFFVSIPTGQLKAWNSLAVQMTILRGHNMITNSEAIRHFNRDCVEALSKMSGCVFIVPEKLFVDLWKDQECGLSRLLRDGFGGTLIYY